MGFRVEMREIKQAEAGFRKTAESVVRALEEAKDAFNGVVVSGAMSGEAGQAVALMVNNGHCAVLTGLVDCYRSLVVAYEKVIADFSGVVGERDSGAVIDSGVLEGFKRSLSGLGVEKGGHDRAFRRIYNGVDDIVSLLMPSSGFSGRLDEVVADVDDLLRRVGEFDVVVFGSELVEAVTDVARQVERIGGVAGLPVGDRRGVEVFSDSGFADGVAESCERVRRQRQAVLEEAARQWERQHPLDSFASEDEFRREFDEFLGEVGRRMSQESFILDQAGEFMFGVKEDVIKSQLARSGVWVKGPWGRVLKAVPVAGSFIDFSVQVAEGEEWHHALAKTGLHGLVGAAGGAVGATVVGGIGALFGASAGSVVPVAGTAVGGVSGAAAGVISGAVGGGIAAYLLSPVVDTVYDRVVKGEPRGDVGVGLQGRLREVEWGSAKGLGRVGSGLVFGGVAGR